MTEKHILLVEDSLSLSTIYQQYLRNIGVKVQAVDTGDACLGHVESNDPSVVILDLGLPDMSGIEILKKLREERPETSVVVITNNASLGTAVEAMKLGAFDYVVKPFNAERLNTTVRNALERAVLNKQVSIIKSDIGRDGFHGFIGASLPMQAVYRIIESAAPSKATVFITGESGTGKEVCANAIHAASDRNKKTFVPLNCAAIPRELMESEIFGHVKGAFSGATSDRSGAAAEANGGTLFLDEICELDLDLQAKLLRLLQSGTYQRVGSSKPESCDLRVVCATNRDPLTEVRAGRFREDLYYRLHVIPIHLPPLRERGEDVMQVANALLARFATEERKEFKSFSPEAVQIIGDYPWPGNIRELQNALRNAVVLNSGDVLEAEMLPRWIGPATPERLRSLVAQSTSATAVKPTGNSEDAIRNIRPLWMVEKEAIMQALDACDGNVNRAATYLEVGASTLYRKKSEFEAAARRSA